MSDSKYILDRPISGDVEKRYYKPIEQWDAERLLADLDAVFAADETVAAIRWYQYTPYFNDGEPCEFRCHLNDDGLIAYDKVPTYWSYDEATDEEDNEIRTATSSHFEDYRGRGYTWIEDRPDEYYETAVFKAVNNLIKNWKHYEHVCREHFGEHSNVVATREGFNVEFYEHD